MTRPFVRRALCAIVLPFAWLACSSERPGANGDLAGDLPSGTSCATPNDDCPCDEPGKVVDCGKVTFTSGDYVTCSIGRRTCIGSRWGECVGDHVRMKHVPTTKTQNLAATPGPTCTNTCDPYCLNYVDDPIGGTFPTGFVVTPDGGLTISGGTVSPTVLPGLVQVNAGGLNTCSGTGNIGVTGTCNAAPLTSCQQDRRCDTASDACVWNGGDGYADPAAPGADLTLGAPCNYGGGITFPVCNRGSIAVAAGAPIQIHYLAPSDPFDGCNAAVGTTTPDCSVAVPAGGLGVGACMNVICPPTSGDKNAVVNAAGNATRVAEPGGRCGNNATFAKVGPGCATCNSCDTRVRGRVMDPGRNVGLSNVIVFESKGPVAPLTDATTSPVCDNCSTLVDTANILTGANTGVDGRFELVRVAPGPNRIVAQSGRWRRVANVDIPACVTTTLTDEQIRCPSRRSEGDIPKTALVEGDREVLECWLLKVGIHPDEIWPRGGIAPGDTVADRARIQLFRQNGMGQAPGRPAAPGPGTLFGAGGPLSEYAAVLLPCDSGSYAPSATITSAVQAYVNGGGRMFMDHLPGSAQWLNGTNAVAAWKSSAISTWQGNVTPTRPAAAFVWGSADAVGTARRDLVDWLGWWAAFAGTGTIPPGSPFIRVENPRADGLLTGANVTEWIRGRTQNNWSTGAYTDTIAAGSNRTYTMSFSFESTSSGTIRPLPAADTCGRVIYNGMHVSQARATPAASQYNTSHRFPTACDTLSPLTDEEKALEYQLFALTACPVTPPTLPPPPGAPPPPPNTTGIYTRDFQAVCPPGTRGVWRFFKWQAEIPGTTSIAFSAQTAPDQASLSAQPTVTIGTASTTMLAPVWASDANTVEYNLNNDIHGNRLESLEWLRVTMAFTRVGPDAPLLYNWQQEYDCRPSE